MNETPELAKKRKETQEEILAIRNDTVSVSILNFFNVVIPNKVTKDNPLYWILIILFLNIGVYAPTIGIVALMNEFTLIHEIWLDWLLATQACIAALIASYFTTNHFLEVIAHRLVSKINNLEDLSKLKNWLTSSWSIVRMGGYVLVTWVSWIVISVFGTSIFRGKFIGYGLAFATIPSGFLFAIAFYYLIWFFFLSKFLGNLKYDLNSISPSHSEATSVLSTMFTSNLYISATFIAVLTLLNAQISLTKVGFPFVLLGWIALTAQFIANRSTISKIVDRGKWKTLNNIQSQINQIQENEDISEKNVNEKLFRLVDTYERIRVTSTNKLEIKSILNFFSQMMLPLLGLLLGNLDDLLKFLKWDF